MICGSEKNNSISGSGSYMMFNLDEVFGKRVKKTPNQKGKKIQLMRDIAYHSDSLGLHHELNINILKEFKEPAWYNHNFISEVLLRINKNEQSCQEHTVIIPDSHTGMQQNGKIWKIIKEVRSMGLGY